MPQLASLTTLTAQGLNVSRADLSFSLREILLVSGLLVPEDGLEDAVFLFLPKGFDFL